MSCSLKPCAAVRDVMLILAGHDLAPDSVVWQHRTFLGCDAGRRPCPEQANRHEHASGGHYAQTVNVSARYATHRKGLNQHNSCSTAHCPATCVTRQVNRCWRQHRMASSPSASMMHSQFVFGAQIVASNTCKSLAVQVTSCVADGAGIAVCCRSCSRREPSGNAMPAR